MAPAPLEDRLRAHPLVGQCMVVGDNRPFVGALITLEADGLQHWRRMHHKEGLPLDQLTGDADLVAELQKAVDDANSSVSRAESIRAFAVLPVDFTEESGHLTPSMKLRRAAVAVDFAEDIEALYRRRKHEALTGPGPGPDTCRDPASGKRQGPRLLCGAPWYCRFWARSRRPNRTSGD